MMLYDLFAKIGNTTKQSDLIAINENFKVKKNYHQQGFCVRRAEVQSSTAVFQLNSSNNINFCASISRPNVKPKNVACGHKRLGSRLLAASRRPAFRRQEARPVGKAFSPTGHVCKSSFLAINTWGRWVFV